MACPFPCSLKAYFSSAAFSWKGHFLFLVPALGETRGSCSVDPGPRGPCGQWPHSGSLGVLIAQREGLVSGLEPPVSRCGSRCDGWRKEHTYSRDSKVKGCVTALPAVTLSHRGDGLNHRHLLSPILGAGIRGPGVDRAGSSQGLSPRRGDGRLLPTSSCGVPLRVSVS